jgi:hypothetical protein
MLARSLLTIALGGSLLALLALRGAPAQSPTAPTASIDPEAIDAIWQKASSKYDGQRAELLLPGQIAVSAPHPQTSRYKAWTLRDCVGARCRWDGRSVPGQGFETRQRSRH